MQALLDPQLARVQVPAATCCMTTYEYRAPGGLNHGLSMLHNEIDKYMVPPMVEHASALLGDFVILYQEREFHCRRLAQLEQQALETGC